MVDPDRLLNPTLYRLLQQFASERGLGTVEVVSPGSPIAWGMAVPMFCASQSRETGHKPKLRRDVEVSGEEFKMRCPMCKDHRARMYVNHRWGVQDPITKGRNLWLVQCFNEQCYSDYEDQERLFNLVFATPRLRDKRIKIAEPEIAASPLKLQQTSPPGPLWPIDQLAKDHPNHKAVLYLVQRGYDLEKLSRMWGVGYCRDSRYRLAGDRLIFPIYMDGMLVGWQARYIGDSVNGVPFNEANVPKYWSDPNLIRRLTMYNYNRAIKHRTVIIVEGPTDVINTGPMATGLLGKTMSPELRKRFITDMKREHGDNCVIVVMLDPKKDKMQLKKNKPHHIEELQLKLQKSFPRQVVPVYLPEEYDPGSIDRRWAWKLIRQAAEKQGLKATFTPPSKTQAQT